jgi:hypothetical protein
MGIYRVRKLGILRSLMRQYGVSEAYGMYGEFINRHKQKCIVCGSDIRDYSEWSDTGYEIKECLNGCWKHSTYAMKHVLETNGFYFSGRIDENIMNDFERQLKINAKIAKRKRQLFWKKKRSQRKNAYCGFRH